MCLSSLSVNASSYLMIFLVTFSQQSTLSSATLPKHGHQSKLVFSRYFYALDLDNAVSAVTSSCYHGNAVKSIPKHLYPQSTCPPPNVVGVAFAVDVMKRYRQLILVLCETVPSYTLTTHIESERHECLRDAIITVCRGSFPGRRWCPYS